ncbi:MAG: DUF2088 domain-containing protein, partial [Planctomycetaceae bacterium]|nr:DUF2088 domain-containing protein [Planctomycetaceae bacterium]
GAHEVFRCRLPADKVLIHQRAPEPVDDLASCIRDRLASPLDFPALSQALLADDRIVIALDHSTPCAAALVRGCWDVMEACGVDPANVLIARPSAKESGNAIDPRSELPDSVREQIRMVNHDPADQKRHAYLATTTSGERVYLAREIVEAEFVLSVGAVAYDPVLGFRGTNSVLYPGLSNAEAIRKSHGQGHDELGPNDIRNLRQTIDEVGWLLGVQFTLQVVPGGRGQVAEVIAGALEAVFQRGKDRLASDWLVSAEERHDLVVVGVDQEPEGDDWSAVGAALATARQLVKREGKILVFSDLGSPLTPGLELIRDSRTPRDALQPLRRAAPEDLVVATQIAHAVDRANVYLVSQLDDDLVEEMFMTPIVSAAEAIRLIESCKTCAFIESAQHTYGVVKENASPLNPHA